MTALRRIGDNWPLIGFALLLLTPGFAIRCGLLPFDLRFEALILVSALSITLCVAAGFSFEELGLRYPWVARHWVAVGVVTLLIAAGVYLEAHFVPATRPQPNWATFAPFYIFISSPCQEVVCRSIPRLIAEKLHLRAANYVIFSAAIFSLMHIPYGDALLLANTFVIGLAWASAYHVTRNIWPVAASHAVVGALAFWLGVA